MLLQVTNGNTASLWDDSGALAENQQFRLDVPRRGHVLTTVTEKYGRAIRDVVGVLSDSLEGMNYSEIRESLLTPPRWQPAPDMARTDAEMAAWIIVAIWVVGVAIRAIPKTSGLRDAEQWFFGGDSSSRLTDLLPTRVISQTQAVLQMNANAKAYYELLPYLLDPHGPGSRLSVRRDPATLVAQVRKRREGVFYTPADLAEYMVRGCLNSINGEKAPLMFDPACGTGVFLRAALTELRERHHHKSAFSLASEYLFGADIDPWPLNASAFVLLADVWTDAAVQQISPAEVWRRLRLNLGCIDTLRIDPDGESPGIGNAAAMTGTRISMSGLFSKLWRGPAVIIGNPPYTNLGDRSDLEELGRVFKTLAVKPHANAEIYLTFVEQMTRLVSKKNCACALVLPLSIACNIGRQFIATRIVIQETKGQWRFAFFDREPHALFGEDVKTRNAILFWSRRESDTNTVLASGPLKKWRGDSREEMFNSIRFTGFEGDIRTGIPKIDGECQASALKTLSMRWSRLEHAVQGVERLNLAEAPMADDRMVFVGPTAYNFLNVFLRPPPTILDKGLRFSEHPLYAIRCASPVDALIVFGILTSHLAYWWWHSQGDGFHVSRRFISEFPFGLDVLGGERAKKLCENGAALWSDMRTKPITSLNRGRISLAYSPNRYESIRRCADEALAAVAGLNDGFVNELQQFTAHTVAAKLRDYSCSDSDNEGVGQ